MAKTSHPYIWQGTGWTRLWG